MVSSLPFLSTLERWTTFARFDFGIVSLVDLRRGEGACVLICGGVNLNVELEERNYFCSLAAYRSISGSVVGLGIRLTGGCRFGLFYGVLVANLKLQTL